MAKGKSFHTDAVITPVLIPGKWGYRRRGGSAGKPPRRRESQNSQRQQDEVAGKEHGGPKFAWRAPVGDQASEAGRGRFWGTSLHRVWRMIDN